MSFQTPLHAIIRSPVFGLKTQSLLANNSSPEQQPQDESESPPSSSSRITVGVRVRPLIDNEKNISWRFDSHQIESIAFDWKTLAQLDHHFPNTDRVVSFSTDRVYSPKETTKAIYENQVSPLVKRVVEGYNATVFAYGQTTSGKTYTITGNDGTPGILQLALDDLFHFIKKEVFGSQYRFTIKVSYCEIYQEKIRDLLNPSRTNLRIMEDPVSGPSVHNLSAHVVNSVGQSLKLLNNGLQSRRVGKTEMSGESSRSHTIFQIRVESKPRLLEQDLDIENYQNLANNDAERLTRNAQNALREWAANDKPLAVSTLNIIDLAGSERVSKSKAQGVRLREAGHINKSLAALGNVIVAINENANYIPFRSSKLTRLLSSALGGNSLTSVICCLSPALVHHDESRSTLQFAERASRVRTHAKLNQLEHGDSILASFKTQVSQLQHELARNVYQKEDLQARVSQLESKLAQSIAASLHTPKFSRTRQTSRQPQSLLAPRTSLSAVRPRSVTFNDTPPPPPNTHELETLKAQLVEKDNKLSAARVHLECAQDKLREFLINKPNSLERVIRVKLLQYQSGIVPLNTKLASSNTKCKTLQQDLVACVKDLETKRKELREKTRAIALKDQELAARAEDLETSQNHHQSELLDLKQQQEKATRLKEQKLIQVSQEVEMLHRMINNQKHDEEIRNKELELLHVRLNERNEELKAVKRAVHQSEAMLKEQAADHMKQDKLLHSQLAEKDQKNAKLTSLLHENVETKLKLEAQVIELFNQIDMKDACIKELNESRAEFNQQVDQFKASAQSNVKLTERLTLLESQLNEKDELNSGLNKERKALRMRLDELQSKLDDKNHRCAKLQNDLSVLVQAKENVEKRQQHEISLLRLGLDEKLATSQRLEETVTELKSELKSSGILLKDTESRFTEQLRTLKNQLETEQGTVETLQSSVAQLRQKLAKKQENTTALEEALKHQENLNERLQKRILTLQEELQQLRINENQARLQLKDTNERLAEEADKATRRLQQITGLQTQAKQDKALMSSLRLDLDSSHHINEELRGKVVESANTEQAVLGLKEEKQQLEQQLRNLKLNRKNQIESVNNELNATVQALEESEKRTHQLREKETEMRLELDARAAQIDEICRMGEEDMIGLKAANDTFQHQLREQLKRQIEEMEKVKEDRLAEQRREWQNKEQDLLSRIKEMEQLNEDNLAEQCREWQNKEQNLLNRIKELEKLKEDSLAEQCGEWQKKEQDLLNRIKELEKLKEDSLAEQRREWQNKEQDLLSRVKEMEQLNKDSTAEQRREWQNKEEKLKEQIVEKEKSLVEQRHLQQQLSERQQQLLGQLKEMERLKEDSMIDQCREWHKKEEQLKAQIKTLEKLKKESLAEQRREWQNKEEKLKEQIEEKEKSLVEQRHIQQQLSERQQQLLDQIKEMERLKEDSMIDQCRQWHNKEEQLKAQIKTLEKLKADSLTEQRREYQSKEEKLKEQMEEKEKSLVEQRHIQQQLSERQQQLLDQIKEMDRLKEDSMIDQCRQWQNKEQQLMSQIEEMEKLKERILLEQHQQRQNWHLKETELNRQIEELRNDRDTCAERSSMLDELQHQWHIKEAQFARQVEDLDHKLNAEKSRLEQLQISWQTKEAELSDELHRQSENYRKLEQQLQQQQLLNATNQAQVEALQLSETRKLQDELRVKSQILSDLQEENEQLKSNNNSNLQHLLLLESIVEEKESLVIQQDLELREYSIKMKESDHQHYELKLLIDELQNNKLDPESQVVDLELNLARQELNTVNHVQQVKALQGQLEKSNATNARLEASLQEKQRQLAELRILIDTIPQRNDYYYNELLRTNNNLRKILATKRNRKHRHRKKKQQVLVTL